MNRQAQYRTVYKKLHKNWEESSIIYRDTIHSLTNVDSYILDVGCGHGDLLRPVFATTDHTYGIDPDAEALKKNTLIKNTYQCFVEKMPFDDNVFDLVCAEWVLEHLNDPDAAFREIYRVLKPGGRVIFMTPNAWNYNAWIIRMIPNYFHAFFTKKLYGRQEGDTYPVRYRINSPKKLKQILEPIGFTQERLMINGDPTYISFNALTFAIGRALERVLDWKPLRNCKVHLIGVYQKPKY